MVNIKHGEFCKVFGITPTNRVMEFFLACRELDFTIGDVARETGLNRATAYNTMEGLIQRGYILPTRKVAGGQLYKLNAGDKGVRIWIKAFNSVLKGIVHEYAEKERAVAYTKQR